MAGYLEEEMDKRNRDEDAQAQQIMDLFDFRTKAEKIMATLAEEEKKRDREIKAFSTTEGRKFQEKCRAEFDAFLSKSDAVFPGRQGVVDIEMGKGETSATVYSAICGPIIRRTFDIKDNSKLRMYSDVQAQMDLPDKVTQYQGYCILPDQKGISKYIFASVTRKQYNGLQKGFGVFDIGEAIYSGFFRDENGLFHEIIDQSFMDYNDELGNNEYYENLEKEFNKQLRYIKIKEDQQENEM